MFTGTVIACIGLACRTFINEFDSFPSCNGASILFISKLYESIDGITQLGYTCEPKQEKV